MCSVNISCHHCCHFSGVDHQEVEISFRDFFFFSKRLVLSVSEKKIYFENILTLQFILVA